MKKISGVFFIGTVLLVQACSLGGGTTQPVTTPISILSIYNGNSDADGDVNMTLNSVQVNLSPISYKTYIPYFKLDPGTKAVKFTNATSGVTLIDTTLTLNEFKAYSIFLAKKANSTKLLPIFTTDEGTLTTSTNTMVRFINLSPDSQAVSVIFLNGNSPLTTGVLYTQASPYVEYQPLDYNVEIRRTSDNLLLTTTTLPALASGLYQTIVFSGYLSTPVGGQNTLTAKVIHD